VARPGQKQASDAPRLRAVSGHVKNGLSQTGRVC
jgi:hypothetical protein